MQYQADVPPSHIRRDVVSHEARLPLLPAPLVVVSQPPLAELSQGKEFGVYSANTWRLADLGAKHAFLRAALGWGGMPVDAIKRDLANRSLVKIRIEDLPEGHLAMAMFAVFRTDRPPGPAGRWLLERLKSDIAPRARPKARRRP